ncbi:MAG: hypothetical protein JXB60_08665 [Candidatus Cloacimonetes bacterium]|nr:hypothetical protein [Candidatus Cloacimonadota bacterium]
MLVKKIGNRKAEEEAANLGYIGLSRVITVPSKHHEVPDVDFSAYAMIVVTDHTVLGSAIVDYSRMILDTDNACCDIVSDKIIRK